MFLRLCSIGKSFTLYIVLYWFLNVLSAVHSFRMLLVLYSLCPDYVIPVYITPVMQWLTRRQAHLMRAQGIPVSEYGVSCIYNAIQCQLHVSWKLLVIA